MGDHPASIKSISKNVIFQLNGGVTRQGNSTFGLPVFLGWLFGIRQLSVSTAPMLDPISLKFIAIGSSTFGMLALLLDINTGCKSQRVQQILAIKLMPLQQAKKSGSQMDAVRELDELTAE